MVNDVTVAVTNSLFSTEPVVEGQPDRPGRARTIWEIQSVSPLGDTDKDGNELFYLVQRAVGALEQDPEISYQVYYVPRAKNLPPTQRLQLSYLDAEGSIQNALRRGPK